MESAVELNELMERIRSAADRENGAQAAIAGHGGPGSQLQALAEQLPRFLASAITVDMLNEVGRMLPNARLKNAVSEGVPKVLRPLFRNQGGFNGVMLEVVERLVTANQQLGEQVSLFRGWADSVGQECARNRAATTAVDFHLRLIEDERLVPIESRLDQIAPADDARWAELSARIKTMEAGLAQLTRQVTTLEGHLTTLSGQVRHMQTPGDVSSESAGVNLA